MADVPSVAGKPNQSRPSRTLIGLILPLCFWDLSPIAYDKLYRVLLPAIELTSGREVLWSELAPAGKPISGRTEWRRLTEFHPAGTRPEYGALRTSRGKLSLDHRLELLQCLKQSEQARSWVSWIKSVADASDEQEIQGLLPQFLESNPKDPTTLERAYSGWPDRRGISVLTDRTSLFLTMPPYGDSFVLGGSEVARDTVDCMRSFGFEIFEVEDSWEVPRTTE